MKTLLLFLPSTLVVGLLFFHAWRFRGRGIAISFFAASFLFGVARGNLIHYVTVEAGDAMMPYVIANPVLEIGHGSIQACIGWVFALYVSWWLAERILAVSGFGQALSRDLTAVVGLACVNMAALSYATEAAASVAGWWFWTVPTRNAFFVGVPSVGIVEWFAVGYEFLIPYLLIVCSERPRRWWVYLTPWVFVIHLLLHLAGGSMGGWLPTQPFVAWHWLGLVTMAGLALGGFWRVSLATGGGRNGQGEAMMFGALGVFAAVMAFADLRLGGRPDLLVSLVPLGFLALLGVRGLPAWAPVGAALAVWVWGGLRPSFLVAPAPVLWLFRARAAWGDRARVRLLYRTALCAGLAALVVALYRDGLAQARRCSDYVEKALSAHRYERQGQEALAEAQRREAESSAPGDVESHLQIGYLFERRGLPDLAIRQYERAIAIEPNFFLGYYDIGIALEARGDLDGALANYGKAVEIAPRFYEGHLRAGWACLRLGRMEAAFAHLRRAAEIEPRRPEPHSHLGLAYQKAGDWDRAAAEWGLALKIDPGFAEAQSNLAGSYLMRGRFDEAIRAYEAAIQLDPGQERAYVGLAEALGRRGGASDAARALEVVRRLAQVRMNR